MPLPLSSVSIINEHNAAVLERHPRLRAIIARHGQKLFDLFEQEEIEILTDSGDVASLVVGLSDSFDPTPNRSMTQWMVRSYIAGGWRFEDGDKLRETLELFVANRARLQVEQRDIGRYRCLADLWHVVKRFHGASVEDDTPTGRELRRQDRARARAESHILREDEDGFIAAVPFTGFAAAWWARGTRWCTNNTDTFLNYHAQGPMMILVLPDGRKLQMHMATGQFMDEDDSEVTPELIDESWQWVGPALLTAAGYNDGWLKMVRPERLTAAICRELVARNGRTISRIPLEQRTDGNWLRAVAESPFCIGDMPPHLVTQEVCDAAVRKSVQVSEVIPEDFVTEEAILAAIGERTYRLSDIPHQFRSEAVCSDLGVFREWFLHDIPLWLRTREICDLAYKDSPSAIRDFPEEFLTPELCKEAIMLGASLEAIPRPFVTPEICMIAVTLNSAALVYVPEELKTEELCDAALWSGPRAFGYMPEGFQTLERAFRCIRMNPSSRLIFSDEFQSAHPEVVLEIVRVHGDLGPLIHDLVTPELCGMAVSMNGEQIANVPYNFLTAELFEIAIRNLGVIQPSTYRFIPSRLVEDMRVKHPDAFPGEPMRAPRPDRSGVVIEWDDRGKAEFAALRNAYGRPESFPAAA